MTIESECRLGFAEARLIAAYGSASSRSIAGMPAAVLAHIGRRAPVAEDGRGPVIIGEAAERETGSIIVLEADRIGQPVMVAVAAMMPAGVREARRENGGA